MKLSITPEALGQIWATPNLAIPTMIKVLLLNLQHISGKMVINF